MKSDPITEVEEIADLRATMTLLGERRKREVYLNSIEAFCGLLEGRARGYVSAMLDLGQILPDGDGWTLTSP